MTDFASAEVIKDFAPFVYDTNAPELLRLEGEIDVRTPLTLKRALQQYPQIKSISLLSPGGAAYSALAMATDIRQLGLTTKILAGDRCYSACAILFFSGSKRTSQGELGVHQLTAGNAASRQFAAGDVVAALSEFGVPSEVVVKWLQTPHNEMYVYTPRELSRLGLIEGPSRYPAIIYDLGGKFDKSFNEAGYRGATNWAKKTGIEFLELEVQNDAQREQALRQFARRGASPIVVPGFSWGAALEKVAAEFPDTDFAIIDMVVNAPNVRSIVFTEHEGSFLVGALAAMKSETGKIGFVGGMDIPLIHKFYCGYAQGAKAVNPDAEIFENYTGTTPAAWNDPVTAGELAKAAFNRGADVVYAAAGGSGIGVLQAAADEGKFSIGVDSNQNYIQPGSVLTSMVKKVDVAVGEAFQDGLDGTFTYGFEVMGLEDGGVGYALDEHNETLITDEMKAVVENLKAKIISGEIVVHDYTSDGNCPLESNSGVASEAESQSNLGLFNRKVQTVTVRPDGTIVDR